MRNQAFLCTERGKVSAVPLASSAGGRTRALLAGVAEHWSLRPAPASVGTETFPDSLRRFTAAGAGASPELCLTAAARSAADNSALQDCVASAALGAGDASRTVVP